MENDDISKQEIETRAYSFYLQRGCENGHALEDWVGAELEFLLEQAQKAVMGKTETAARLWSNALSSSNRRAV